MNTDFARQQMVEQQIRAWDVFEVSVLEAIQALPREQFVPPRFAQLAYTDTEIPLQHGQKMMKPIVEGRLLQALELNHSHSVLEIGTGSGYLTACLAALAGDVTSIDYYQDFVDQATGRLSDLGIDNVTIECMDAMAALPEGRFDAIAVTGSMPKPDQRLLASLKPGGRMFVITGDSPVMSAELVTRGDREEWQAKTLFETDVAPLLNVKSRPAFTF
jgi:protein-L-isoaspartate(D-aspartate) O-methyltransferase